MARTISTVSAVTSGTTQAVLTMAYAGTYDGGNNSVQCGGGSGQVYTAVYKRDITAGGAFVLVTTLTGGTTGATGYTVTGLTPGTTYEFQANSYQRREAYDGVNEVCVPVDTGLAAAVSNTVSTPADRVTAAVGALALTGQAAALRATRTIAGAAGSLTLSGQSAVLTRGWRVIASPGSYTLTGKAAELRATGRLHVEAGAFALAGGEVTLRFGYGLPCEPGDFTLTGNPLRWGFWDKADASDTAWSAAAGPATEWTPIAGGSTAWTPIAS